VTTIILSSLCSCPVTFNVETIFGSNPAFGDVDHDGIQEVVMATDDSIHVLKFANDSLSALFPAIPFGFGKSQRPSENHNTPQALIAQIGNTGKYQIIANHYNGGIWAYDIDRAMGIWSAAAHPGFPLKTAGRVSQSCALGDLDGKGTIGLVAADDAGFIYV
jgi:hypothetical protein